MAVRRGGEANSMAAKRIRKEIADLAKENLGAITLTPNESNIFQWKAVIPGPAGSPYEGGEFEVDIRVPDDYPFSPPQLHFKTKVYHCNISHTGAICLDLLKNAWSPALSLYKVILSLSSLLTDPNPSDPLVPSIAQEYKSNRKKHDATAKEWVERHAKPKKTVKEVPPPAKTARPRPVHRDTNGSPAPPPPLTGSRRRANGVEGGSSTPINLMGSDDEDDVQVVEGARRPKRPRVEASSSTPTTAPNDEVIVIDD